MFELRAQRSVVGLEEGQPEGLDRVLQGLGREGRIPATRCRGAALREVLA